MDGISERIEMNDELRKEFEAAYPMPEGIVRNQWGKYSPFDKETFLMTESLIYNVRYEVYQAAALKRDSQIAALIEALQEVVAISDRKHDAWDKAKAAIAMATYSQTESKT